MKKTLHPKCSCLSTGFLLTTFFIFFFSFFIFNLSSQSTAEEIETLLNTKEVTYAQAARFILEASDIFITPDPYKAYNYAVEKRWLPKRASPDESARLDGISLLFMPSFGLKGGIMYTITKSSHFAYRELTYRNLIQGRIDPAMKVSGDQLLFVTGRILSIQDEEAAILANENRRLQEEAQRRAELDKENVIRDSDHPSVIDKKSIIIYVQFLPESIVITDQEKARLRNNISILQDIPGKLRVIGHTAMVGTAESCLLMSIERARAVADYLIELGVRTSDDIIIEGYGAEQAIGDNTTAAGMAANRRVEIVFYEN
jgi:outer membrane protein OmpA-like peptidoglycan-associated protein